MAVGKMNPKHGMCYLPYGGKVVEIFQCQFKPIINQIKPAKDRTKNTLLLAPNWKKLCNVILLQEIAVREYEMLCLKPICDMC